MSVGTEGKASHISLSKSGDGREPMEDRDIGEKGWLAAEDVGMDEIGGAVEGGEVNIGYLNVEGSLYTGGTIEPRVGISGSSLRTGNCGVSSSVLRSGEVFT